MIEKESQPLTPPPPKLSRAAAERILEQLSAVDTHDNYIFAATAPVYVARRNGDLVEIGTAGEILMIAQQAVTGFDGGA